MLLLLELDERVERLINLRTTPWKFSGLYLFGSPLPPA